MMDVYVWQIQETDKPGKGAKFTITIPKVNLRGKDHFQTLLKHCLSHLRICVTYPIPEECELLFPSGKKLYPKSRRDLRKNVPGNFNFDIGCVDSLEYL
jgi:hypothetical protein